MPFRLNQSIQAMAEVFPQFTFENIITRTGPIGIWRGRVQPIKTLEKLPELLDDLYHDREVYRVGDEIRHLPSCNIGHCRHNWMDCLGDITTAFDLEIRYDGGRSLPRAWVRAPEIPSIKEKHTWTDKSICAFLASDDVWIWHTDTVAQFVPHVLIWLVKWVVFDKAGVWIGSEHEGTPQYHLSNIQRKAPCWCGSGKPYRKCCYKKDLTATGLRAHRRHLIRKFRN